MEQLFFGFVFLITIGSACVVAFSNKLIYSAFALIGTFAGVAATFVFLSADFVGLAQILVYAGGILVLTIFAVMLTAKIDQDSTSNPVTNYKAVVPMMVAFMALMSVLVSSDKWKQVGADALTSQTTLAAIGHKLLTDYLFPFELISVLLLMSMVGAAIITRRHVKE